MLTQIKDMTKEDLIEMVDKNDVFFILGYFRDLIEEGLQIKYPQITKPSAEELFERYKDKLIDEWVSLKYDI